MVMSTTIGAIDNSVIDAYVERCMRFRENVHRLQEQIQHFKEQFFGEDHEQVYDQFATQEQESFAAQTPVMDEPVANTFSTSHQTLPQTEQRVMPEDIDIDALVSEIATNAQGLAM